MTSPDPAEPEASTEDIKPPRLMSAGFWIAMGFALFCIVAGVLVVKLGPSLFPATPPMAQPAAQHAARLQIPGKSV